MRNRDNYIGHSSAGPCDPGTLIGWGLRKPSLLARASPRGMLREGSGTLLSEPTWTQAPCPWASYNPCLCSGSVFGNALCTAPRGHRRVDRVKQDPEMGEQCHLLREKINCLCLFPLRACCIYYGDLAGLVPQPGQPSRSHRSLQALPAHTEQTRPRALGEDNGKNPKPCRLRTSGQGQDTPLQPERLLWLPPRSPAPCPDTTRSVL